MADVDLIFRQAPLSQPADLVFGEVENLPDVEITLNAALPPLTVNIDLGAPIEVTLVATLPALQVQVDVATIVDVELIAPMPGLIVDISAKYRSDTQRPVVGQVSTDFQIAIGIDAGTGSRHQGTAQLPAGVEARWLGAEKTHSGTDSGWVDSNRLRPGMTSGYQEAKRADGQSSSSYRNMLRSIRPALESAWQEAEGVGTSRRTSWQERYRDRRPSTLSAWGVAQRLLDQIASEAGVAVSLSKSWSARHQEAMVPPPGMYRPTVPPALEPCYTPPPGSLAHLLFDAAWSSDTNLVFICERHVGPPPTDTVIVPVKRVYMVINNATLMRVDGTTLTALPTYSMSLSIDVDSWTWGFNASLPAQALDALQPDTDGTPVELQATINGESFRVLAEKLGRDRSFGRDAIRVTGRGKSALLADPYAPIMNFKNTTQRTAQQLMNDALTLNGSPIGWDIDWQIDDWLVPANAWNKTGRYIDALTTIAGAAGAYLQPHPTDQVMRVLARYPAAPWDWGAVIPDFELPSAVTSTEGTEWLDKPRYNRVYVSGTNVGVEARVTRAGTAGDVLAPMVTDELITDEVVARQRGTTSLSDTGRQAKVSLRLPVLEETGIILPGKFIRYVDGLDTKVGIVRSTGVEMNGQPDIWQSIVVETHL